MAEETVSFDQQGQTVSGQQTNIGVQNVVLPAKERPLPLQAPRPAAHFQGRQALIAEVLDVLHPGRIVTLYGMGGIGKTAVTAEIAARLGRNEGAPPKFPAGVIFYSFYGRPSCSAALQHILSSLGIERARSVDDAARAALAGRQMLLILDGAEEADDLERICDLAGDCAVLISSRKKSDVLGDGFEMHRLPLADAQVLFNAWGGGAAADQEAVRAICELLGSLPLAVRLAGRQIAGSGLQLSEYLAWLRETRLEALDFGRRRSQSVPVLMAKICDLLSARAKAALQVAGTLALAPFTVETIAAALDIDHREAQRALGELLDHSLLERPSTRYNLAHPLLHTYAREELGLEREPLRRLAAYYDSLAREESARGLEGYKRLDEERSHILRLLAHCQDRALWEEARLLVWAVHSYLDIMGYWEERWQAADLGINAARAVHKRRDEGAFLIIAGLSRSALGEIGEAIGAYEQALAIAREIEHRKDEGMALGNLGIAYYNQGQVQKAIDYYERALAIRQEIGDRRGEGNDLGNLGNAYRELGQVQKAIDYYERALAISQEIGDRRGEGNDLSNLGITYEAQGDLQKARQMWRAALLIYEEIESPTAERVRGWLEEAHDE